MAVDVTTSRRESKVPQVTELPSAQQAHKSIQCVLCFAFSGFYRLFNWILLGKGDLDPLSFTLGTAEHKVYQKGKTRTAQN
jgi:hypothetical protein